VKIVGKIVKFCLVLALGWIGIMLARQAFTNVMESVIASEPGPATFDTRPIESLDGDCILGPMNDRPVNQNHCHVQALQARDAPADDSSNASMDKGMTKSESERAALWFGGSMLAILLALGVVGAGAMWFLRE